MRFRFALYSLLLAVTPLTAMSDDLRAVTEDGRKVILSPDFKWKFDIAKPSFAAPLSPTGNVVYQSQVKKFSVTYDTAKWVTEPPKEGDMNPSKKVFKHRTLPVYALVIADELPLTNEKLRNVILINARASGSEPKILMENNKQVNGNNLASIRFTVIAQGIDFLFWTQYLGSDEGNIQIACYTGQSLFFKYEAECQQFLDGFKIR